MTSYVATPEGVITRFSAALLANAIDDLAVLFEPDAIVLPAAGGGPLRGRPAIRDALAGFAAMRPAWTDDVRRVVHTGDIAVVHNHWRWSAAGPDGSLIEREGLSSNVMRRQQDGSWAFVLHDPAGGPERPRRTHLSRSTGARSVVDPWSARM